MRHLVVVLALLPTLACEGMIAVHDLPEPYVEPPADGGVAPTPSDAAMPPMPTDASRVPMPDAPITTIDEPDAGPPAGPLADDLEVTRVDLFQTVRVPLVRGGEPADRDGLPVVMGRDALIRVHAAALAGYVPRPITAVVELERDGATQRFTDTKSPALPATDDDPASVFAIRIPGDEIALGTTFRIRLEADDGVADAIGAIYPSEGGWDDLGVEDVGIPTIVLVPFRYETDGSGRLPDVSEEQLQVYRDELTSRFPYAEIDLRVHPIQTWSRANRLGGNVDWGAVNARLISMRDAEGAPETEYWYGLIAPDTSRDAYCDRVVGSCVTGQAYVATLRGSRVGSGVGFGTTSSARTLAHEIGHEHGRSHTPCGTSSSDSGYPHSGGKIGVWGWDRRTGDFHDPDVGTDMMGYCSRQWISDYTYRAMYERQRAMRAATWSVVGAPVARRFVTIEDGETRWSDVEHLRRVPGELAVGTYVDARGVEVARVEVGVLTFADSDGRTYVVPADAPVGAVAVVIGGERIAVR